MFTVYFIFEAFFSFSFPNFVTCNLFDDEGLSWLTITKSLKYLERLNTCCITLHFKPSFSPLTPKFSYV